MSFLRVFSFGIILSVLPAAAQESSAQRVMSLAQEAAAATAENDHATALAKLEEAVSLRADTPRTLLSLAAAQVANDKPEEAIATLERTAALGVHASVERDERFTALRERKEFQDVAKTFAANDRPKGAGEIAFTLREVTGLIESIAWRESTGDFYFGDVNGRAVWVRGAKEEKDGKPRRLTPESEELLGVFGLAIDEERGVLWAATAAVPQMQGFQTEMEGTAGVAEIDLETGEVRRVVRMPKTARDPRPHVFGDVAVAADGTVFATNSAASQLWRLPAGGEELELVADDSELFSPQGLVVLPDQSALLVADYVNGLVRLDLQPPKGTRLAVPENVTLGGLDGLTRAGDGSFVAIQNGIRPNRVLRLTTDASAESVEHVEVLEAAHLQMGDPTLGCIGPGGDFFFIGNAGWSRFGDGNTPMAPRPIAIFKTKL